MYCIKCGQELPDEAKFCFTCGSTVSADGNDDTAIVSFDTSGSTSERMTTSKDRATSRIISDGLDKNDVLFSIFASLVEPLEKIEKYDSKIQECNRIIDDGIGLKPIRINFLTVLLFIVLGFFTWSIGTGLLCGFDTNSEAFKTMNDHWFIKIMICTAADYVFCNIVKFLFKANNYSVLKKKCKSTISKKQEQINVIVDEIKGLITFVPPAYRSSAAISSFCKSYRNSRANNLSEAIRAFEEDRKFSELNSNLQNTMTSINSTLNDISYAQQVTNEQLRKANDELSRIRINTNPLWS